MTTRNLPDSSELWRQLETHVNNTLGSVGIEKMLGGRRSGDPRARWTDAASGCLASVAEVAALRQIGDLRFVVGDAGGVTVQLGISHVQVFAGGARLTTILWRPPAAVILSEWAFSTWGETWTSTLNALKSPRTVVHIDEGGYFPGLDFVAQDPSGVGPYISASSSQMAQRGGQAEDLGEDGVRRAIQIIETRQQTEQRM